MARLNPRWDNFSKRSRVWDRFWQDAAAPAPAAITSQGIASTAAVGAPSIGATIAPSGIAGAAAFGAPVVQGGIASAGVLSAAALGAPALGGTIAPSGVPSTAATGAAAVGAGVQPGGVASGAALGAGGVSLAVSSGGIPSGAAIGAPTVESAPPEPTEHFIEGAGIQSSALVSQPEVAGRVDAAGIQSTEAFGQPTVVPGEVLAPDPTPPPAVGWVDEPFDTRREEPKLAKPWPIGSAGVASTAACGRPVVHAEQVKAPALVTRLPAVLRALFVAAPPSAAAPTPPTAAQPAPTKPRRAQNAVADEELMLF